MKTVRGWIKISFIEIKELVYFIAKIWRYVVSILFCDFIYIEFITPAFL